MLAGQADEVPMDRQTAAIEGDVGGETLNGLDRLTGINVGRERTAETNPDRMRPFDDGPNDDPVAFEQELTAPALIDRDRNDGDGTTQPLQDVGKVNDLSGGIAESPGEDADHFAALECFRRGIQRSGLIESNRAGGAHQIARQTVARGIEEKKADRSWRRQQDEEPVDGAELIADKQGCPLSRQVLGSLGVNGIANTGAPAKEQAIAEARHDEEEKEYEDAGRGDRDQREEGRSNSEHENPPGESEDGNRGRLSRPWETSIVVRK
jgi:hypothetical protein